MEMHEIRYFLAACETLNFHRAAAHCHVTQPALTRAIQKLEAELGGLLFHRENNQVQLTEFGRMMRPHLQEVLRTRNAEQVARSFLKLEACTLDTGSDVHDRTVAVRRLPQRVSGAPSGYRDQHRGKHTAPPERTPAHGSLDMALMAQPDPFDQRLLVEPVYHERFGLAFPAGHAFEQRNTLHVTDVCGETYLSRINCEYRDHLAELCREYGVGFRRGFRSEREDWIMAMVAAGMGICFLPEYSAAHPGIRHRLVADPQVVREVSLVSVTGRTLSPAASSLVAAMRNYDWANGATTTPR